MSEDDIQIDTTRPDLDLEGALYDIKRMDGHCDHVCIDTIERACRNLFRINEENAALKDKIKELEETIYTNSSLSANDQKQIDELKSRLINYEDGVVFNALGKLKTENADLKNEVARLKAALEVVPGEVTEETMEWAVEGEIQELKTENAALKKENKELKIALANLELRTLQAENSRLRQDLAELEGGK